MIIQIEKIVNEEAKHYLKTWIALFSTFLGRSQHATLKWAQKWRIPLLRPERNHYFYEKSAVYYVCEEIVRAICPEVKEDAQHYSKLMLRLEYAITGGDARIDQKAEWDLSAALSNVRDVLEAHGCTLPEGRAETSLASGKQLADGRTESLAVQLKLDRWTLARRAVAEGALGQLSELIEQGLQLNWTGDSKWTLLIWAGKYHRPECERFLLRRGANPNAVTSDLRGITPLMFAAEAGDTTSLRRLLKSGATFDCRDHEGNTALYYAVQNCRADAVKCLLQNGARVSRNKASLTRLLSRASLFGRTDIIKLVVRAVAPLPKCGELLLSAAENGYLKLIDLYVSLGISPNITVNRWPRTPLVAAAYHNHSKVVRRLIELGGDAALALRNSRRELALIGKSKRDEVIRVLQRHK